MRPTLLLATCACALAGAVLAPGPAAAAPADLRGVTFSLAASDERARIAGRGRLDVDAPNGGGGTITVTRTPASGARSTATLRITSWRLELLEPVARLVLTVRVLETTDRAGCRRGARGLVTVVDDPTGADLARLALSGRCRGFSRTWSSTDGDMVTTRVDAIERAGARSFAAR